MLMKAFAKIILAAAIAAASMSPTFAAMIPKPCASPLLRCTADCGKDHWCKVYACSFNKTVLMPFPCNEKAGGCLQPHC